MTIAAGETATAADMLKSHDPNGNLRFAAPTELTLAVDGSITITQNYHLVDTYEDAATDELDTINGGADGFVLLIRPADGARTVVVKHNTGNILCGAAQDIALDDAHDWVQLVFDATLAKWLAQVPHTSQTYSHAQIDTHLGVSAQVHGLPANVSPLGARVGAGRFVQFGSGSAYCNNGAWTDITVTWPAAFTSIAVAVASARNSSDHDMEFMVKSWSATNCVVRVHNMGASQTVYADAIGIGV